MLIQLIPSSSSSCSCSFSSSSSSSSPQSSPGISPPPSPSPSSKTIFSSSKHIHIPIRTVPHYDLGMKKSARYRFFTPTTIAIFVSFLLSAIVTLLVRNISVCYSGWAWHYTHRCEAGHSHPWVAEPHTSTNHRKIAIAMIVDDFLPTDVREATIDNKKRYAQRWGYDVIIPDKNELRSYAPDTPVAWAKFPLLLGLLDKYDYVLMIDADAVFLRDDVALHNAARDMERTDSSLLISNDLNGPNSGIFMLKSSDWSRKFLKLAMESSSLLSAKTKWLPLRYENRAFFYLLDAWPSCAYMRRVDSMFAPVHRDAPKLRKSVVTVDRCFINRRPPRMTNVDQFFLNTGAAFDDISDAFIAHAAGGNATEKAKSLHQMLALAFLNTTSS